MNYLTQNKRISFEALFYPFLLLVVIWSIFLVEQYEANFFVRLGVLPRTLLGLKGIVLAPLIHDPDDINHIINNSIPLAVLTAALIYFYREIALKVFAFSWLIPGTFVWLVANNLGAFHIGISGLIYSLASFLFFSGTFRKFRPLQAISFFVAFVYGSMVWGILPLEKHVSWEGHLFGFLTGLFLAYFYRKQGPQAPKYLYEIEKELGIEPPDLEGEYNEKLRILREHEEMKKQEDITIIIGSSPKITYDYKKKED